MKVFITKYALTSGIQEIEAEETHTPSMVCKSSMHRECFHGEGKDWHRTWESAVHRAEEMKKKKITSIHKALKKLEKMTFTKP